MLMSVERGSSHFDVVCETCSTPFARHTLVTDSHLGLKMLRSSSFEAQIQAPGSHGLWAGAGDKQSSVLVRLPSELDFKEEPGASASHCLDSYRCTRNHQRYPRAMHIVEVSVLGAEYTKLHLSQ